MKYVSATQITMFRRCPRSWFMAYLRGMKSPPTDAMKFGTKVHDMAEKWLKTGHMPSVEPTPMNKRAFRLVSTAIRKGVIRPACEHTRVECGLPGFSLAGVPVRGFIDCYRANPAALVVEDHKTTSGWKWAKTAPELGHNVQLMIYAAFALQEHPEADEVTIRHNQLLTRGAPDARAVEITVPRAWVENQIKEIEATVEDMVSLAKLDDIALARQNMSACDMFSGCHLRQPCYATPYSPGPTPTRSKAGVFAALATTPTEETKVNPKLQALLNKRRGRNNATTNPEPEPRAEAAVAPMEPERPPTEPEPVSSVATPPEPPKAPRTPKLNPPDATPAAAMPTLGETAANADNGPLGKVAKPTKSVDVTRAQDNLDARAKAERKTGESVAEAGARIHKAEARAQAAKDTALTGADARAFLEGAMNRQAGAAIEAMLNNATSRVVDAAKAQIAPLVAEVKAALEGVAVTAPRVVFSSISVERSISDGNYGNLSIKATLSNGGDLDTAEAALDDLHARLCVVRYKQMRKETSK